MNAFELDAFQSGAFQEEVAAGSFAFQECVFQEDAFQADLCGDIGLVPAGRGTKEHYGMTLDAQIEQRKAIQAIANVAIKQVDKNVKRSARRLKKELIRSEIAWNSFYIGLLNDAKGAIVRETRYKPLLTELEMMTFLSAHIEAEIRRQDEEAVAMMLMCMES